MNEFGAGDGGQQSLQTALVELPAGCLATWVQAWV